MKQTKESLKWMLLVIFPAQSIDKSDRGRLPKSSREDLQRNWKGIIKKIDKLENA